MESKSGDLKISAEFLIAVVLISILVAPGAALSQTPFYQGKTIRLIVGLAPGGGYDLYARVIARHMGKHIPGNPMIIVENMTGAGSVIAANYMYRAAKPDGLTIGHILGGLFLQQLLGNPAIEFDGRKFEYLGVPAQDHFLIGLSKATGITSFELDGFKKARQARRCRPRGCHR